MNTRRNATRRLKEEVANAGAPPHDEQVLPLEENANVDQALANPPPITEAEMRAILAQIGQAMLTQAQATTVQAQTMTAQDNWEIAPHPHIKVTTMSSRLRDFTRMNPTTFDESKVDEDSKEFIDKVSKLVLTMGMTTSEKAEFATYQLKGVAQTWYVQWRDNRLLRGYPVTLEIFMAFFLDQFFLREMREEKVTEFINHHQGGRSVHEYPLKFLNL